MGWRVVVDGLADSAGLRSVHSHRWAAANAPDRMLWIPRMGWEPVSGFEPLACRLQEARPQAPYAIAALMAHVIALTALAALGSSKAPFHETFHADGSQ